MPKTSTIGGSAIFTLHLWNIFAAVGFLLFLYSRFDYLWDKQQPGQLMLFFFGGLLSVLVHSGTLYGLWALGFFDLLPSIVGENVFLYNFLTVGLSEETVKFSIFALFAWGYKSFKEPQDGVLLGALVGLGF